MSFGNKANAHFLSETNYSFMAIIVTWKIDEKEEVYLDHLSHWQCLSSACPRPLAAAAAVWIILVICT